MAARTSTPDVTSSFAGALESMLAAGFELPIYFAMIGRNGSMTCGQYTEAEVGIKAEFLARRMMSEGFTTPINIMFVDSRGKAAKVTIGSAAAQEEIAYEH